ncbi:MAG: tRNA (adenosine(37)-N6)-threonylcarbamoyltransferase complex transferase subunit TsaD [Parcubacteria group bacterium]|nr:tRNA (adenosine(37)-N6)-threonylcarbamoyltransferase complex transferase subunit TsaD [Parcubacteria group bacterium]
MRILSIETSCDETALALVEAEGSSKTGDVSFSVLSNLILSQVKLHAEYGGVYPSLAKREHAKNLIPLFKKALGGNIEIQKNILSTEQKKLLNMLFAREPELLEAFLDFIPNIKKPDIDAIAVTYGPGLEPALWVGINFTKALSLVWNIPIIPVNHMEGHIFSALLRREEISNSKFLISKQIQNFKKLNAERYTLYPVRFPLLALLISGGHTELVLSEDWLQYKIVGETRDDAIGEAFDKVARMLELPYPGGPHVSQKANEFKGDKTLRLPRPMIDSDDFDFSFSGIKTAVLYELKKRGGKINSELVREFSHEFQEAVTEVVVKKTIDAAVRYGAKTIVIGGGVSANKNIREKLSKAVSSNFSDTALFIPSPELTTDNGLMIAVVGYIRGTLTQSSCMFPPQSDMIKAVGTLRLQ